MGIGKNLLVPICCFLSFSTLAQHRLEKMDPTVERVHNARHSEIKTCTLAGEVPPAGDIVPSALDLTVDPIAVNHASSGNLSAIKAAKLLSKPYEGAAVESPSRAATPVVGVNFKGNMQGYSTPPDNTMAISNGGRIVSVDNETIEYYDQNGTALMTNLLHYDFFNDASLTGSIYDPRVIYDSGADRFIFVILHGFNSSNSKVIVSFSKTNDPADGWWTYYFSGNPLNNGTWTDYPNIAVTEDELIITGNLFSDNGYFDQTYIYQISKAGGYSGGTLDYLLWDDIQDGQGQYSFTLVPASHGQQGNYGPGCYLVSSESGFGNTIHLYHLTDVVSASNVELNAYPVSVPTYSAAADAYQNGTSNLLSTGDCRMQHAFYLNGYVHAVHSGGAGSTGAYNRINYYRIPVSALGSTQTAHFGETGYDLSYPSLASFGLQPQDQSVMIGYLRSGSNIFPEVNVVNCDNLMNWSSKKVVKQGETYVDVLNGNYERWGDYSTMQRKHNASAPEVWMSGCFGEDNSWNNNAWSAWIAEIKGTYEPAPVPVADFLADTLEGYEPFTVSFTDLSLNSPTSWEWFFPGATSATSSGVQHPTVTYADTGFFDVSLKAINQFGADSITLPAYIHVLSSDTGVPVDTIDSISAAPIFNPVSNQNLYPNPAREFVHFDFEVPERKEVVIDLLDMNGRKIRVLYHDWPKPGIQRVRFNKLALDAGVYIVQIRYDGKIVAHEKLVVQ